MLALVRDRLGTFAGRVATVAGGVAIGQVLLVAASPVVTRLYDPDDFGVLATYMATIGILGVVAAWRFPTAIALPDDERDALAVLGLGLAATTLTSAITATVLLAFGDVAARAVHSARLGAMWWLIPPGVFALGVSQALGGWLARRERYAAVGAGRALEGGSKAGLQLALRLLGEGGLGLLVADLGARLLGIGVLLQRAVRDGVLEVRSIPVSRFCTLAYRYRDFPLVGGPAALLNAAGLQAPALLLTACYDLRIAGVYALGQRIVAMPSALVGQAASQVFVAEGGRLAREDPSALLRMFVGTTRKLAVIIVVPMAALAAIAPWLFGVVFGETWTESGHFVRLLAVAFALQFVALPLSQTLSILERQRWQLLWDAGRLAGVVGAISICGVLDAPATTAVIALAAVSTVAYIALLGLGYVAIGLRVREHDHR